MPLLEDSDNLSNRRRLVGLLIEAAEFEHSVLCQYLFAAFSLKKHPDEGHVTWAQLELMRPWHAGVFMVARQEMEHLGIVNNLLTAIGEAPHLKRPNFPLRPGYYPAHVVSELTRFSPETVLRFVQFEMPSQLDEELLAYLESQIPNFQLSEYRVEALYQETAALFTVLSDTDPAQLFIGPPSAQCVTTDVTPMQVRGVDLTGRAAYEIKIPAVTDLASAQAAIAQIIAEGEGNGSSAATHFQTFLTIYRELQAARDADPDFEPARPVLSNPGTPVPDLDDPPARHNEHAQLAARLFDLSYETLMLMLIRFYAHSDESKEELAALQQAAFFPMMTTVMRPLGEALTLLPAYADGRPGHAGPSFAFTRRIEMLPHRLSAWRVLEGQMHLMETTAGELANLGVFSPDIQNRLALIYHNIARIRMNFGEAMKLGGTR